MIEESDDLSIRPDEKKFTRANLPINRESFARSRHLGSGRGRAALWSEHPVLTGDPPTVLGAFPLNFLPWAARMLRVPSREILHLCSGALRKSDGGIRVDLRLEQFPDFVADARALPFPDSQFPAVLLDPPYSLEYAEALYGTDYPRPAHLLKEALRVVRPGGRIGFMHFLIPHTPPGSHIVTIRGVTQGCGYRIRALTVIEKEQPRLFERNG